MPDPDFGGSKWSPEVGEVHRRQMAREMSDVQELRNVVT